MFNYFSYVLIALTVVEILASTRFLHDDVENKTNDEILQRSKRFLVFTPNGGVLKFVTGYLGPVDIPLWQNINCLRNMQFQYDLPPRWITNFPTFPGLWKGRDFSEDSEVTKVNEKRYKPDASRMIAYEIVESMMNR